MTDVHTKLLAAVADPYVSAALILLAAILLANVLNRICGKIVARLFFDKNTETGNDVVELLHRPVYVTLILIGVLVAGYRLGIHSSANTIVLGLINTILVVMWSLLAYRLFGVLLGASLKSERRFGIVQPTTAPAFKNGVVILLFLLATYSILLVWDVNITGLVASAGILGLALSFAAQDTLSNLFAGVSILADRSYEIGDFIVLDSGERGEVMQIGLRSTRLLTRDDVVITIPNGVIAHAKIVNEAASPHSRYRIRAKVGIAYGSKVREVITLLEQIAVNHADISNTPTPRVRFRTFGESSLELELLCWICKPVNRGRVIHELNCEIYEAFDDQQIKIPFPQREVSIRDQNDEN